mmetsp:Transcript_10092/g.30199  ORF Transcript_10092/g.30199 Transcript_10092/m.30199 type:complete len:261 (+) Transcript_10092:746-1528(+)
MLAALLSSRLLEDREALRRGRISSTASFAAAARSSSLCCSPSSALASMFCAVEKAARKAAPTSASCTRRARWATSAVRAAASSRARSASLAASSMRACLASSRACLASSCAATSSMRERRSWCRWLSTCEDRPSAHARSRPSRVLWVPSATTAAPGCPVQLSNTSTVRSPACTASTLLLPPCQAVAWLPSAARTTYLYSTMRPAGSCTVQLHRSPSFHLRSGACFGSHDPSRGCEPMTRSRWPQSTWYCSQKVTVVMASD